MKNPVEIQTKTTKVIKPGLVCGVTNSHPSIEIKNSSENYVTIAIGQESAFWGVKALRAGAKLFTDLADALENPEVVEENDGWVTVPDHVMACPKEVENKNIIVELNNNYKTTIYKLGNFWIWSWPAGSGSRITAYKIIE